MKYRGWEIYEGVVDPKADCPDVPRSPHHAPPTGRFQAIRHGVRMSAGSRELLLRMIDLKIDGEPVEFQIPKATRRLTCCCCGSETRGRQWWNRDTGFGVCVPCVDGMLKRHQLSLEDAGNLYGDRGVHYAVEDEVRA